MRSVAILFLLPFIAAGDRRRPASTPFRRAQEMGWGLDDMCWDMSGEPVDCNQEIKQVKRVKKTTDDSSSKAPAVPKDHPFWKDVDDSMNTLE